MINKEILSSNLTEWWESIRVLAANSPENEWEKMLSYLSDDCVLYFNGMNVAPAKGKAEVKTTLSNLTSYWKLVKRNVTNLGFDENEITVFAAMNNQLEILGIPLDFPETEVVKFDENAKIIHYELYCDSTPIKAIFQMNIEKTEK